MDRHWRAVPFEVKSRSRSYATSGSFGEVNRRWRLMVITTRRQSTTITAVCSAENENRTASLESHPALERAVANNVSSNDMTSFHNGEISTTNRVVANLPIPQYLDEVMRNLCNREYLLPGQAGSCTLTVTVEEGEIMEYNAREAADINVNTEPRLALQKTENHITATCSQSTELQRQQQQKQQELEQKSRIRLWTWRRCRGSGWNDKQWAWPSREDSENWNTLIPDASAVWWCTAYQIQTEILDTVVRSHGPGCRYWRLVQLIGTIFVKRWVLLGN